MNEQDVYANNRALKTLVENSGLTLAEILGRFNARQARPIALRTLKTYLANEGARTRVPCSITVLSHMRIVLIRTPRGGPEKS
jgi:hypothetical protein